MKQLITVGLSDIVQASRRFTSQSHHPSSYARQILDAARIAGRIRHDAAGVALAAVRVDVARRLFDLGCRIRIQGASAPIPSRCQMAHRSGAPFSACLDSAVIRHGQRLAYLVPVSDLEGLGNV